MAREAIYDPKNLLDFLIIKLKLNTRLVKEARKDLNFSRQYWNWLRNNPDKISIFLYLKITKRLKISESKSLKVALEYYQKNYHV